MPSIRLPAMMLLAAATCSPLRGADRPAGSLLEIVQSYVDAMLKHGRDTYGPQPSGLFLSALDRATLAPLVSRPAAPSGIRREDRSGEPWNNLIGANPQLDENLLRILYTLSEITGDAKYKEAADNELSWFLKNTMSPATALLPWGEHMCWDVIEDRPISGAGEGIHEFACPWVLWDRCYALAPKESQRFALGLWAHQIADHQSGGFDRHAPYFQHGPVDGKDFPRHAGFYILTWAHAHRYSQEPVFLQAIETLLARFERKRMQKDGSMVSTMGALDCESAAALLPEALANRLRAFAEKEDELTFAEIAKQSDTPKDAPALPPLWKTGYSAGTQASTAMFYLARYEQVKKSPYRDALLAIADKYLNSLPEEDLDVWPLAFGHAISTQVAAYRLTQRKAYLDNAERLAHLALMTFWQDNPLPRASLKVGHYEATTGADSLALALLELHAIQHHLSVQIPSNTIDR